jgi:hypothetical protein
MLDSVFALSKNINCLLVCKLWYDLILKKSCTCVKCKKIIKLFGHVLWASKQNKSICHTKSLFVNKTEIVGMICTPENAKCIRKLKKISHEAILIFMEKTLNINVNRTNGIMQYYEIEFSEIITPNKIIIKVNLNDFYNIFQFCTKRNEVFFTIYHKTDKYFDSGLNSIYLKSITISKKSNTTFKCYCKSVMLKNMYVDIPKSHTEIALNFKLFKNMFKQMHSLSTKLITICYFDNKIIFTCDNNNNKYKYEMSKPNKITFNLGIKKDIMHTYNFENVYSIVKNIILKCDTIFLDISFNGKLLIGYNSIATIFDNV